MSSNIKKPFWRDAVIAFARMSGWVVTPIVISLFLGRWLDRKLGTKPFVFLGLTAIAFLVSLSGILKESNRYIQNIKNGKSGDADNK